jgi:hypothetical protein
MHGVREFFAIINPPHATRMIALADNSSARLTTSRG